MSMNMCHACLWSSWKELPGVAKWISVQTDKRSQCIASNVCFITWQEMEAAERLRVTKTSLEVTNEKLEAELEETKQRLRAALSKPITEGADSKTWKASVVTRSAWCLLSNSVGSVLTGCQNRFHYQAPERSTPSPLPCSDSGYPLGI